MSYFDQNSLQQELCAEQVLAVHFPDIKEWTANYGSFFSRNYTGDPYFLQFKSEFGNKDHQI